MSDFEKILLTASMTILGGFVIHSASQLFLKLFIEPMQDFRKHRAEAISLLSFYSNMLEVRLRHDDTEEYQKRYYKAQDEIRMCMAKIKAAYYSISPRWLAVLLGVVPKQSSFKQVSSNLLTLSFFGAFKTDSSIGDSLELAKDTLIALGAEW